MITQAILFDLDGTLLDTAPEFAHCLNTLLAQEGKSLISAENLRPAVSFGTLGMLKFGFNLTDKDPKFTELKKRFLSHYQQILGTRTVAFPGIQQALTLLEEKKIRWGIVTNKPKAYAIPLVKKFPIFQQAACIIAGDTLATAKPHPEPLLHACNALNVLPEHCWYIGDALTDVQACRNAGIRCAVANYGYIPPDQDPTSWQADHYLTSAEDIRDLL